MKKATHLILAIMITICCFAMVGCAPTKQSTSKYYKNKVDSFAMQNANLSKGQIIFIGDSITDLYHLDDYYADLPIATYNRGIGGDTTQGVLDRLQVSLYDLAPSKIIIMIGINDIDIGKDNDYILGNYRKILQDIKQNLPQTQVYIMSVISQDDRMSQYVDITKTIPQIMQLNSQLQPLAEEFGYTFVDLFSQTSESDNKLISAYSDDGLHLNTPGFVVWTNMLKPYLAN